MLRFGTDGVRGVANLDLTPEVALALGRAAARVLGGAKFVVGRDTRRSGPLLEAAVAAGLAAEGVDVVSLGVAPTPAVAWLAAAEGIPGAVISASHNPYEDNGVKLFTAAGSKLADHLEQTLEEELHSWLRHEVEVEARTGGSVGTFAEAPAEVDRWLASVGDTLEGRALDGLSVVLDCANGSASGVAPKLLRSLGATLEVIHDRPDGININEACGSTDPGDLQRAVVRVGAQVGLAFDGDADRVLAVDADGRLLDGDQIMAVLAVDRLGRGRLAQDTVVVTVMTNLGFRQGMARHGIKVLEVPVGDRFVLEALRREGLSLGGEQSGHVIFADLATTGDGLLTAVQLLDVVKRSGRPLAELSDAAMQRLPQVLHNVRVARASMDVDPALGSEIAAAAAALGARGRVLVRSSGTEPLMRVMVEAPTIEEATSTAARLVKTIEDLREL